jgi:hypothetical protein
MVKHKKGAGGYLNRSQVVTVRLDPKLKFVAELAARRHRRTISSFIQWAVACSVGDVKIVGDDIEVVMTKVWDVDEEVRLRNLAKHYPSLLTYDEEVRWREIQEEEEKT